MLHNPIGQLFSLLSLVFIISLSFFVLRSKKRPVNKIFFFLTLIPDVWMVGSFMMFTSIQPEHIIFWDRIIYAAVAFWPALQYHFALKITYINKKRLITLMSAYVLSVVFFILSFSDNFVDGIFNYRWGYHTLAQTYHHWFVAFFLIYTAMFLYCLIKQYKAEKVVLEKKRLKYFFIGFLFLNVIGGTAFLPAYKISVFPISLAAPLIFTIIIAYAIVYFGLMDVKLIMRRYFVYFISLLTVLLPVYLILWIVDKLFPQYLFIVSLPILILSLPLFSSAKKYFYKISNKYFFSSLYKTDDLIFKLNNSLSSSLDVAQIAKASARILQQAFHSQAIAVFYYKHEEKKYFSAYNKGFDLRKYKVKLDYKTAKKIFKEAKPLSSKELGDYLAEDNPFYQSLKDLKLALIVPVNSKKDNPDALILFGAKESREEYGYKDKNVLESIATQMSISLENAFLYKQVTEFNRQLKSEVVKATKKLKEQNQALKQLDKAKSEFIGIASHQLRTPLTGIRWFNELLLKNSDNNLTEKQINFLGRINESNKRMIKLVNDLLDVSHIETGRKFEIIKSNFELKTVIDDVLKDNIFLIQNKNLKIENKIEEKHAFYGDVDKIQQVLQNLVSNATKYSPSGTSIKLYSQTNKDNDIICVSDSGIGIPKKQQTKIFAKFFRATNASSEDSNGTGLGLYIAREIIRAHGGDLWFESAEGQGSSFYFSLPKFNPKADEYKIKKK